MTGYRRNRRFAYRKYLDMFEEAATASPTREGETLGGATGA